MVSIAEAAERLDKKPWEVVRLLDMGHLKQVVLVDEASLAEYQETHS